jgi:hypothetical protein
LGQNYKGENPKKQGGFLEDEASESPYKQARLVFYARRGTGLPLQPPLSHFAILQTKSIASATQSTR